MDKVAAAYTQTNDSDWDELPLDIQHYFQDIMGSNFSFGINPNFQRSKHGFDLQAGVMATLIAVSVAAGSILNVSLIFRVAPMQCGIQLERALELNMYIGWFLFQVVCIPVLLTHDVLMISWKFGDVMCKLIPWQTCTVMNAQAVTLLLISISFAIKMNTTPTSPLQRVLDSRVTQICVTISIWIITGLSSIPLILEYGVVLYGILETNQCVNIVSVMEPPRYQSLKLQYFIWLLALPLVATVMTLMTSQVVRCCRNTGVNYESVDATESTRSAVLPEYLRYIFIQLLLFSATWIAFQVMTLFAAFSKVHEWLPRHTHIFNVTMTLAYMYPCLTIILSLCAHPYFKVNMRKIKRYTGSGDEGSHLQHVDMDAERQPEEDIVIYSQDESDEHSERL